MLCRRHLAGLIFVLLVFAGGARAEATITVFAAASLVQGFEEIGGDWRKATGNAVRFSFAASSTLARQIEQGAPADLFASADAQWMDYLEGRGRIDRASRTSRLGNRLVLIAPIDRARAIELRPGLDWAAMLGDGRLATGDPAHVPLGRYARAALESLGAWPVVERRLAPADTPRAAMVLVERGEAPLGIVYASDALASPRVGVVGTFPAASHPPVEYHFALLAGRDGAGARAFLAYLVGPQAAAVYGRLGFLLRQ